MTCLILSWVMQRMSLKELKTLLHAHDMCLSPDFDGFVFLTFLSLLTDNCSLSHCTRTANSSTTYEITPPEGFSYFSR